MMRKISTAERIRNEQYRNHRILLILCLSSCRMFLFLATFPYFNTSAGFSGAFTWDPASSNIFSTVGDMFPKSTIATVTGIGNMAGGIGSFLINKGAGMLFVYAASPGDTFRFLGFSGKPAGYMIIFCVCAVAYLIAWSIMKTLVPKYKPIDSEK